MRFMLIGLNAVLLLLVLALPAAAQFTVSASSGYAEPWRRGSGGTDSQLALGATFGPDKRFRLSGEFSYREFETRLLRVRDIDVEAFRLALVFHYRFLPDAWLQPYLGARLGAGINRIQSNRVERGRLPRVDVSRTAASVLFDAIVGLEAPLGDHVFLFAEGTIGTETLSVSYRDEFQPGIFDDNFESDSEQVGGYSGRAGLRFVF